VITPRELEIAAWAFERAMGSLTDTVELTRMGPRAVMGIILSYPDWKDTLRAKLEEKF